MDFLWTPWRYAYIAGLQHKNESCVFCVLPDAADETARILYRGQFNYIVLNSFPYTSGHSMVVPFRHFATLPEMAPEESAEMMALAQRLQRAVLQAYQPEGFNIGWNQGRCAGAGVVDHLHLHLVPRWIGDSNLVAAIGETRVLPEDLATTFQKLKVFFT